jgi:ribonuclease VapC
MTVVDSSAVLAVLRAEPDASTFADALQRIEPLFMSAGTLLELGTVVLHKRGAGRLPEMFRLLELSQIEIVPVTEQHARDAIEAYGQFGRCTRHPAKLNFGDCFSYALARTLNRPLLFKGDDFGRTDIRSAL